MLCQHGPALPIHPVLKNDMLFILPHGQGVRSHGLQTINTRKHLYKYTFECDEPLAKGVKSPFDRFASHGSPKGGIQTSADGVV